MDNDTKKQLRVALELNYWSVDHGLYFLVKVEPTHEEKYYFSNGGVATDIANGNFENLAIMAKSHNKEIGIKIHNRYQRLKKLWHDTDHCTKPRLNSSNPNDGDTEFKVEYFIKWALSRSIDIYWLDWAIEQGLISDPIEVPVDIDTGVDTEVSENISEKEMPKFQEIMEGLIALNNAQNDVDKTNTYANMSRLIRDYYSRMPSQTELLTDLNLKGVAISRPTLRKYLQRCADHVKR